MKSGWYFNLGRKEFFVVTDQQRKTNKMAEKILKAIGLEISDENIKYILYIIVKATLEIKHCPGSKDIGVGPFDYYNIFGKGFSGYGSNVNDGNTILIEI